MNGINVSAGGRTDTFGLKPSSSGDGTSAYSTLTLTPSPLLQSVIDARSSSSSACLGSCPRYKVSPWKGIHLLPLFRFLCVALTGTLYSQELGLCIIIHVRDQMSVLTGNGLTQLPGILPHLATGIQAPKLLPSTHSWYSFVWGAPVCSPAADSAPPHSLKPFSPGPVPAAEVLSTAGAGSVHLCSLDSVGSSLLHIDFMGLGKPCHRKLETLPRRS